MTIWHDLHTGVVHPWLCDQFGHLNVRNYSNFFNEAMFHALARAGFPQTVVLKHGGHSVAAITRTNFFKELPIGTLIRTDGGLIRASNKTLTFFCRMHNIETDEIHATMESLEVFFDPKSRKSSPIPSALGPIIKHQLNGPDLIPDLPPLPREEIVMSNWLELHRGVCFPWHCDQFGHMNVRWYAHFFDDAIFHMWPRIGISWKKMEERGVHTVTASTTTQFRQEVKAADLIVIEGTVAKCGTKSVTFRQRMLNVDTGVTHAFQDVVEVFFDPESRSSTPIPDDLRPNINNYLMDLE